MGVYESARSPNGSRRKIFEGLKTVNGRHLTPTWPLFLNENGPDFLFLSYGFEYGLSWSVIPANFIDGRETVNERHFWPTLGAPDPQMPRRIYLRIAFPLVPSQALTIPTIKPLGRDTVNGIDSAPWL